MRALALLALVGMVTFAGCIRAPAQAVDSSNAPAMVPNANATLPKVNLTPVELPVSTTGQYPVNPGFDPATLKAPAGSTVHVTFSDADLALPLFQHDWVLEKVDGAKTKAINPGEKAEVTFTAPAKGTYKYYCDIGDHRARGMEGTLTVE
ncbi:MAG: cupredoxin domain-containing protein [Halobacteriales archaeon]|nr:cupredoxin domain-containing protein [Halobacteriales archaeon]